MATDISQNDAAAVHQLLLNHNVFIKWDVKYSLGIPILDEQHRGIVTTINSLHFGIRHHYIENTFAPIIEMMSDYTRIHFEIEEAYLEMLDFSQAKRHHELHGELMEQLLHTGKMSLYNKDPHHFLDFLKSWWISHICNEDLQFRDHLLGHSGA